MVRNIQLKGVVHGKTIELDQESGLPDGAEVAVVLRSPQANISGLIEAFGGWTGEDAELDEFLAQMRRDRHADRRDIPQ